MREIDVVVSQNGAAVTATGLGDGAAVQTGADQAPAANSQVRMMLAACVAHTHVHMSQQIYGAGGGSNGGYGIGPVSYTPTGGNTTNGLFYYPTLTGYDTANYMQPTQVGLNGGTVSVTSISGSAFPTSAAPQTGAS